jgi:hypothetical protein
MVSLWRELPLQLYSIKIFIGKEEQETKSFTPLNAAARHIVARVAQGRRRRGTASDPSDGGPARLGHKAIRWSRSVKETQSGGGWVADDARRAPGAAAGRRLLAGRGGPSLLRGVTADEGDEVARGFFGRGRLAEPLHYETDEVRLGFRPFPAARMELLIRAITEQMRSATGLSGWEHWHAWGWSGG